jgi:iron complex outermembrane receptor protein
MRKSFLRASLVMAGSILALASAARAEDGTAKVSVAAADAPDAGTAVEAVIVTGLRGGAQRTVADSPAPIDVLDAKQLNYTGRAEFSEALSKLLPSVNFGTNQAGINSIVRPITNRGLGPAYTLVLVNGKRRHNSSLLTNGGGDTSGVNAVDLDLIPTSAVQRIEVLKDSAAAQYGSDAVAGVVNVVLDNNAKGGSLSATYGALYDGEGDLDTYKIQGDLGFALGQQGGFVHLSGDYRKRGLAWWNLKATDTNLYGLPTGRTAAQVIATAGITQAQYDANVAAAAVRNAAWNADGAHNGDPEVEAFNLTYNAELPVSDTLTVYSYGTYGERDTVIGNNFRRPNSNASFSALFPNGYYPLNNTSETDYQFVGGGRGKLGAWDWDFSLSQGRNRNHQFSDLAIRPALGPTSPTRWPNLATFQFEQTTANLDVTRELEVGLARPLSLSFGAEARRDHFRTFAADPLAYTPAAYVIQKGDQQYDWNVGVLASPVVQAAVVLTPDDVVDLKRDVVAGYVDLGLNPTDKWYVGLAVRGEHYTGSAGGTVGVKVNSRYDFTDAIAVRGTVGTGFRAPSLTQIGYAQTDGRTAVINGVLQPNVAKLARNDSQVARLLGAQDLKPEESWNLGLGVVLRPASNVNLTIDAYHIVIKDRIVRTGRLFGPSVTPILVANGLSQIQSVEYFTNAVDTRTDGVDVVLDTTRRIGDWGRLRLSAAFNYNKTDVTHIIDTPAQLSNLAAGSAFFGPDKVGELTVLNPHTKLILGGNLAFWRAEINLQTSRYGGYVARQIPPTTDRAFGSKWITDLDVTVSITDRARVAIGASNLFDIRPETNGVGSPQSGAGYYAPSPYAPSGGFYYTRLSLDF